MLKPTDSQIRTLARLEADPRHVARFAPITRGPVFAVVALACVGIAALPWILAGAVIRLARALFRRPQREIGRQA